MNSEKVLQIVRGRLLMGIGDRVGPGEPQFVEAERVWRVPLLCAPPRGQKGAPIRLPITADLNEQGEFTVFPTRQQVLEAIAQTQIPHDLASLVQFLVSLPADFYRAMPAADRRQFRTGLQGIVPRVIAVKDARGRLNIFSELYNDVCMECPAVRGVVTATGGSRRSEARAVDEGDGSASVSIPFAAEQLQKLITDLQALDPSN